MAKRFIDSEIWERQYFREAPPKVKLLWIYINTRCDMAGIWNGDFGTASHYIGEPVDAGTIEEYPEIFGDRVIRINGKWWSRTFVEFQYGALRPESRPHQAVLRILTRYGLAGLCQAGPDSPPIQPRVGEAVRARVFERDGEVCVYCLEETPDVVIDHVLPVSAGGKNTEDNLVVACGSCNSKKADHSIEEFCNRYGFSHSEIHKRLTTKGIRDENVTAHTLKDKDKDKAKEQVALDLRGGLDVTDEFSQFWEIYPRRIARAKVVGYFAKRNHPPIDVLVNAVKAQIVERELRHKHGLFVPEWKHPYTWLNQGCWDDEVMTEDQIIKANPKGIINGKRNPAPSFGREDHESAERLTKRLREADRGRG